MKISKALLKWSIFKNVMLLILVAVGIYLLEYKTWSVNGVELEGKMIDQLMTMIPSQCGPMRYPVKYFQMFYEPLRPYIFWALLLGTGLDFFLQIPDNLPRIVSLILAPIKFLTGGLITGINLLLYTFFKKKEN